MSNATTQSNRAQLIAAFEGILEQSNNEMFGSTDERELMLLTMMTKLENQLQKLRDEYNAVATELCDTPKECDIPQEKLEPTTPVAAKANKGAARVKKSKQVDKQVEATKGRKPSKQSETKQGKRDVNAGDKERIDATKQVAMSVKPEPVQQAKGVTKKRAEKAKSPTEHDGMSYKQLRSNVSTRKAALNKADQERLSKHAKNNTWEGAIACYEWLNKYFPAK